MKCPDCESGKVACFFPVYVEGHPGPAAFETDCPRCGGTCEVPDEQERWIAQGKAVKAARLSRGIGLREQAERLGMLPSVYAAMENGRIKPEFLEAPCPDA